MQSPCVTASVPWSKDTPAGSAALLLVSTPAGRVLAWQSRHDAGWSAPAAVSDVWYRTAVVVFPVAQVTVCPAAGGRWQTEQSAVTRRLPVGKLLAHLTASWRISPEAGTRAGLVAVGPTKPIGVVSSWHELHAAGCGTPFAI